MREEALMEPEKAGTAPAIRIAADRMQAIVIIDAGVPVPSVRELREALEVAGVNTGILSEALENIAAGTAAGVMVVVASGTVPVKGEDGWIEWLFAPKPGIKAMYRNAAPGQRIAVVHPPSAGTPGMSVQGEVLPPVPGKPAHLRKGSNTSVDSADPDAVVATAGGNIVAGEGSVDVQPVLTVNGQIDYGTGNVDFAGSLVVNGDIRGDITVRVKGSLTVHGNVEDAEIEAGEDVTITKGFVGRGKGRLAAGGSVTLLHLLNQTVTAGKDVHLGRESVNGTVDAKGIIDAPRAVIAGGVLHADGGIVVNTKGSTDGPLAKIRAGKRGRILERLPSAERELKQAEEQTAEVKEAVYRLVRMQIDAGSLDAEKQNSLRKLQAAQKALPQRIAAIKAELAGLKDSLKKNQDVTVKVCETVFENTKLEINGAKKIIDAALSGVTFRERNGMIEVSSC